MLTGYVLDPVPPHDRWAARAERDMGRIRRALGPACVSLHHVGATSVPGLPAAPVLDLMAELSSHDLADAILLRLMVHGYVAAAPHPTCRVFVVQDAVTGHPQVELRCYPAGHEEVQIAIAFFAHLRAAPDDAAAYDGMKRDTRARHGAGSPSYHAAKQEWMRRHHVAAAWAR